jgi:hypothetical protein
MLDSPLTYSPVNEKKLLSKLEKHTLVDFPEVPPQLHLNSLKSMNSQKSSIVPHPSLDKDITPAPPSKF